ncbi:MAG: hypothetical protein ABJE47_01480 [bacterium]
MFYSMLSRNRLRAAAVAVALASTTACGRFYSQNTEPDEKALVVFANQSLDQADVYAVIPGSAALRMGSVMAGRTDTLVVPTQVVSAGGNVNIVARLLARSYTPATGPVTIRPGDALDVRLGLDDRYLSVLPSRP